MKWTKLFLLAVVMLCYHLLFAQADQPVFSLFLIGDAGEHAISDTSHTKTLRKLKSELTASQYQEKSAVIYLGDNVYPCGMAPDNFKNGKVKYQIAPQVCCGSVNEMTSLSNTAKLSSQLEGLEGYDGSVFMVPGNHDWQRGERRGQEFVINEKRIVDEYFSAGKLKHGGFYPKSSFGPNDTLIKAEKGISIRLIFIDSQWWLHAHNHHINGLTSKNWKGKQQELNGFLNKLDSMVLQAKHDHEFVVIAEHHPIYTFGKHSTKLIIPIARWKFQNIDSKPYHYLRIRLDSICNKYAIDKLIFAAGHDHNLQYFRLPNYVEIVSGAGCKCTNEKDCTEFKNIKVEKNAPINEMHGEFNATGFFRVDYFSDNSTKIFIWEDDLDKEISPSELNFSYHK
ncbi:MAG: metallophosphoesterase [Chitinophagales bacterium]